MTHVYFITISVFGWSPAMLIFLCLLISHIIRIVLIIVEILADHIILVITLLLHIAIFTLDIFIIPLLTVSLTNRRIFGDITDLNLIHVVILILGVTLDGADTRT